MKLNHGALELGKYAHHLKHRLAGRRRGVDPLLAQEGHPCLARVELCISPPHQSGEQCKKHQKNAGGKNNSPQLWNVPGDPCPKDRPAADRQQDVQQRATTIV